MNVEGMKYITYRLAGHQMTVRYYVTDVIRPSVSLNGINKSGYSLVLSKESCLVYFKDYVAKIEKTDGMYYMVSGGRQSYEGAMDKVETTAGNFRSDYGKTDGDDAIRVYQKEGYHKPSQVDKTHSGSGKDDDHGPLQVG